VSYRRYIDVLDFIFAIFLNNEIVSYIIYRKNPSAFSELNIVKDGPKKSFLNMASFTL